jgi:thymidylate synthase ThyX
VFVGVNYKLIKEKEVSLDKSFFTRNTNITAKVICDSISEQGVRLTTFEIEYPRFIHSEVMTHRNLSKNSSSSRAIPVSKMLEHTKSINLKPIYDGPARR